MSEKNDIPKNTEMPGKTDKLSKILNPVVFFLAIIFCLTMGIVIGNNETSDLTTAGAIVGAIAAMAGALASFMIMKLIFPVKGKANWASYLLGVLTVIMGIAASGGLAVLLGYIIIGDLPEFTLQSIIFFALTLLWIIFMIWRGMEAPVFPAFLLGALLGALFFVGITTVIPGLSGMMLKNLDDIGERMSMLRIAFAILGAYCGSMGASLARASGWTLKDQGEKTEK